MKTVIILGMHRSGTSCLAGSLQASELELGEVFTENPYNKKGNRENDRIMKLHDSLLAANGASWHQPTVVEWDDQHRAVRDDIIASFSEHPVWGFKDPRSLFTLDGWREVLPNIEHVGTIRNPKSVAASLLARNAALGDVDYWYGVWEQYNRRLVECWRERAFPIVDFDQPDDVYLAALRRVYRALGLAKSPLDHLRGRDAKAFVRSLFGRQDEEVFFDPALRSNVSDDATGLPDSTASLYAELKRMAAS